MNNIEMENIVDTTTETQDSALDAAQDATTETTTETAQETKPYVPFSQGKEKFKIDGKEFEWDWDTTKKYAQLGSAATKRMQEAAAEKKRVQKLYTDIIELAKNDPVSLVRALNPQYDFASATKTQSTQSQETNEKNPYDQELYLLKNELGQTKEQLNQIFLEREKQTLQGEIDQIKSKYPIFENKHFLRSLLLDYNNALEDDVSLDDLAFVMSRDLEAENKEKEKQKVAQLQEKRKRAPVNISESSGASASKPMTFDDVKRLAGLK